MLNKTEILKTIDRLQDEYLDMVEFISIYGETDFEREALDTLSEDIDFYQNLLYGDDCCNWLK